MMAIESPVSEAASPQTAGAQLPKSEQHNAGVLQRHCPMSSVPTPAERIDHAPRPWILRRCLQTGFVYLENPPDYQHFEETFAWEQTWAQASKDRQGMEPLRFRISGWLKYLRHHVFKRNKMLKMALRILNKQHQLQAPKNQPLRYIDVGCGWGDLLVSIYQGLDADQQTNAQPFGVEISKNLAAISDEKLKAVGGGCAQAPALQGFDAFPSEYFDLVVMSSFLEHEIQPLALLKASFQALKPGGQVLIKVPNYNCLNRLIRGPKWCGYRWPDHVNYFTPRTLKAMSRMAGFELESMRPWDCQPFSDNMYLVLRRLS